MKFLNLDLSSLLTLNILKIFIILGVGIPLIKLFSKLIQKLIEKKFSPQVEMIIQKIAQYFGFSIVFLMILNQLGIKISALLGAAGIAGIAIGFASQTSVSNIISGLFLIWEEPFMVGDVIKIGDTTGSIVSIDLLSIKLKAFDNRFIRIPNENIIKTQVTNITNFPIRRLDIEIGVAYKEDVRHVLKVLKEIADQNPYSLDEPEPYIALKNFGEYSLDIHFGVWVTVENYFKLKKEIMIVIKERFDEENIEIPFPHVSIYTGLESTPMPVQIVKK